MADVRSISSMEYVERMSSTSPTRAETDSKVLLAAAAASASRSPSETGMPNSPPARSGCAGRSPDEGDGDEDDREEHAEQTVARRLIDPPLAAGRGWG
ncbi:MAG: hypothetical protein ACLSDQ_12425 [Adlercreutzia equolifaciens]